MDEQIRDAETGTPEIFVPFSASMREILIAVIMYAVAYVYLVSWNKSAPIWFTLFSLGYIALVEWRFWERPRSKESWLWLGCLVCILAGNALRRNQVWEDYFWLLSHAFAIYWTLCRAGMLCRSGSSTFLPMDAINGAIVFPFRSFFLRIRTLWYALRHPKKQGRQEMAGSALFLTATAVLAALALLYLALRYLASADLAFAELTSTVMAWLTPDWNSFDVVTVVGRFLLSLPVGAYLFGLICGTAREERTVLDSRTAAVDGWLEILRQVSARLWNGLMAVFAVLYLVFFVVQLPEMLGGFTRTLPQGLTVAEYARQGFFSLCRVMAVNFALLWLSTRTSSPQQTKAARILVTVLLVQSLLFAVIAASKLGLYIDCFGFTPKRLQSAWLILALFGGCVAWMVSLWRKKKTFHIWLMASGALLALLHLY